MLYERRDTHHTAVPKRRVDDGVASLVRDKWFRRYGIRRKQERQNVPGPINRGAKKPLASHDSGKFTQGKGQGNCR